MECFAGLDVSLEKTHICVLDRDGAVAHEATAASSPAAIATALGGAPACSRVVFETGRMAPMLYHGLAELGVPVVCLESRQAYQALKTLATHKTDPNDARGLAQLARTGFFKPVALMTEHKVRHLPVIEGGNLAGIVSMGDLAKSIIADREFMIDQLSKYIAGSR